MNEYTSIERKLARLMSSSPKLKALIKKTYITLMRLSAFNKKSLTSSSRIIPIYSLKESFFGYYDKCPSNGKGLVLFHSSDFDTSKPPQEADHIDVNLMNEDTGKIIWASQSKAFNWQQGSRLQWLTDKSFIYADFDQISKKYISKVVDTNDFSITKYNFAVQDGFQTKYFLSLNYRRLRTLRPDYGYFCLSKMSKAELEELSMDGIWKVNLETHSENLLVSLDVICAFEEKKEFKEAVHKVNHIQINPSGNCFVFLHRYFINGKRFDRFLLADSITGKLTSLSESILVSHFYWLNSYEIIVYLADDIKGEGYFILNILNKSKKLISKLSNYGDGHPSGINNIIVTDTYPNRAGMQSLFLLEELDETKPKLLGTFYHPLKFDGESRCDLHPRLDWNRKVVYFDTVYSGKRQLYKLEIM